MLKYNNTLFGVIRSGEHLTDYDMDMFLVATDHPDYDEFRAMADSSDDYEHLLVSSNRGHTSTLFLYKKKAKPNAFIFYSDAIHLNVTSVCNCCGAMIIRNSESSDDVLTHHILMGVINIIYLPGLSTVSMMALKDYLIHYKWVISNNYLFISAHKSQ